MLRGGDERALDLALARQGLASQGASGSSPWRPVLQVLPLALELVYEPRDPYRVIELVTLPIGPFQGRLGRNLADALAEAPGIGGRPWREAKDGIFDPERRAHVEEWFEQPGFSAIDGAPRASLLAAVDRVLEWTRNRLAVSSDERAERSRWHTVRPARSARASRRIRGSASIWSQFDSSWRKWWGSGCSSPASYEQSGRLDHVSAPAGLRCSRDVVVWWHCVSGPNGNPLRIRGGGSSLQHSRQPASTCRTNSACWLQKRRVGAGRFSLRDSAWSWSHHATGWGRRSMRIPSWTRSWRGSALRGGLGAHHGGLCPSDSDRRFCAPRARHDRARASDVARTAARMERDPGEPAPSGTPLGDQSRLDDRLPVALDVPVPCGTVLQQRGFAAGRPIAERQARASADRGVARGRYTLRRGRGRRASGLRPLASRGSRCAARRGHGLRGGPTRSALLSSVQALVEILEASKLHVIGVEIEVEVLWHNGKLSGRLDLLLSDPDGNEAVVDLKWVGASTGRSQKGQATQLAVYVSARRLATGAGDCCPRATSRSRTGKLLTTQTAPFVGAARSTDQGSKRRGGSWNARSIWSNSCSIKGESS